MVKKIIVTAAAIILAAAAILTVVFLFSGDLDKHIAVITVDGETIRTVDLRTAPDETFTVGTVYGSNTVCIKDGSISVTEASCPDKICVKHGALNSEFLPIVCMPNKLVIELK